MAVYGLFALVLESTVLSGWPTQMLRFDLLIVAVAALAFNQEWRRAVPVLVFYGFLFDVASGTPFGMTVLAYLLVYGGIRLVIAKISFQGGVGLLFWVAIISLVQQLIASVSLAATTGSIATSHIILRHAPAQALIDAVVGMGMVPFLKWYGDLSWERLTRPKGLVLK